MKKLFIAVTGFFIATVCLAQGTRPLAIGSNLPMGDLKLKDITSKEVSIKDAMKQHGVLVMFSCNTCPYVIKNQSRTLDASKHALGNDVGVAILNSNEANRSGDDSFDAMKKYATKQSYDWHYLVDKNSTMADAFGANRTPECFLFDKNGKLVYHGAIDDNPADAHAVGRKHLEVAIDEMVAGKEVSTKQSKSVGCGIKRQS